MFTSSRVASRKPQRQRFSPPRPYWMRLAGYALLWFVPGLALLSQCGQWSWLPLSGDLRWMLSLGTFMLFGLAVLWSGMLAFVGLISLLTPAYRAAGRRQLAAAAPLLIAGLSGPALTGGLDRLAIRRVVHRAAPLVDALDRYQADHGHAAPTLDSLVPRYLPAVPTTGWPRSPHFAYEAYGERVTWRCADLKLLRVRFETPSPRSETYVTGECETRASLTRRYGAPQRVEPFCCWRLSILLFEDMLDDFELVAEDAASSKPGRYGRWEVHS